MGADFRNQDERVYRLLGCEMTVHAGELPQVGDTLCYQIEITGHAEINGIRLFFFQYDCRVNGNLVFSVRHGQAGFFTMKCRSLTQRVVHGAVGFYRLFRMCQQMRGFTMGIFIMTPACQAP